MDPTPRPGDDVIYHKYGAVFSKLLRRGPICLSVWVDHWGLTMNFDMVLPFKRTLYSTVALLSDGYAASRGKRLCLAWDVMPEPPTE